MSDITQAVARLIVDTQPDDAAREQARRGVLDFFAVALPVVNGALPDATLASLRQIWPGQDAQSRALRLGYSGHALDFDDFHPDFRGHVGTVILPALLALSAESAIIEPTQFLDAFALGVEMAGRLGLAVGSGHYVQSFHNTSTLGVLAAAAACARLVKADPAQTANILAIAATQAAGLRVQFGSDIKPLHAGLAARAAVTAVQLTQHGVSAQTTGALESFLAAYSPTTARPALLTECWGAPWRIVTPGLEFKPWPTCSGTHGAALAALTLREKWLAAGFSIAQLHHDVERIEVAFPPGGDVAAFIHTPTNGVEARFSLEYVIAECLLDNDLPLSSFAPGNVKPATAALAARVVRTPDHNAPPDALNPAARFHRLRVTTRAGVILETEATRQMLLAKGVDLAEKLHRCLPQADDATRNGWLTLTRLESAQALRTLQALLLV
ncbi:2-methylcitrate dehydratase PrpD [Enterobacter sp. AG5470]|nr:2-methylcitrate dehydratase PrpD [Enterobacter sp. AG5470]